MLFRSDDVKGLFAGDITLAFRRWKRPTVKAGGRLRIPGGVLAIEAVEAIEPADVTDRDARRAGRESRAKLFAELKCEVQATQGAGGRICVTVGPSQRLLVLVSQSPGPIHRAHEEITRAFRAVQLADASDRVVFLAQGDTSTPPMDRSDPVLPDARDLLEKMGVEVVSTTSIFRLWRLWLEDSQKARRALQSLHAEEGRLLAPWR